MFGIKTNGRRIVRRMGYCSFCGTHGNMLVVDMGLSGERLACSIGCVENLKWNK